jgi:glucuronoxylan 4-O-methyltransferase
MAHPERTALEALIHELVDRNPNQLSVSEYHYVAGVIATRPAARLLVFGVGNDSPLWLQVNQAGVTVFLEDSPFWAARALETIKVIDVRPVHYDTRRTDWESLLDSPPERLWLDLPNDVARASWDVILVDGPTGFADECPGRMQSIYTAARLARQGAAAEVIVHDCDREVERSYCERFLPREALVTELERLRHYRVRDPWGHSTRHDVVGGASAADARRERPATFHSVRRCAGTGGPNHGRSHGSNTAAGGPRS